MAASETIIGQVRKESAGESKELFAADGDVEVRVNIADSDRLGFLVNKLEMKGASRRELKLDPIRVEKEVTYLGEPLRIVELEKFFGRAIIRSYPPRMENGTVSFFEITLDRLEGLSLGRMRYNRTEGTRSPVPACFSREMLERLLSDLLSFVRQN